MCADDVEAVVLIVVQTLLDGKTVCKQVDNLKETPVEIVPCASCWFLTLRHALISGLFSGMSLELGMRSVRLHSSN